MARDLRNWRIKTLIAALLPFAMLEIGPVHAQSIMRTPSLHIDSRVPTFNPTVAPRINSNVGAGAVARTPPVTTMHAVPRIGVRSTLPYARYSPNLYPSCEYAYRGSDGECFDRPIADGNGSGKGTGSSARKT
jgi:hypothetical protein